VIDRAGGEAFDLPRDDLLTDVFRLDGVPVRGDN
jgi:hypothetical protein